MGQYVTTLNEGKSVAVNPYNIFVHPHVFDDYKNKVVNEDEKNDKIRIKRWPKAIVPYTIHHNLDTSYVTLINEAIQEFNYKTSVNWTKKQKCHSNYVEFKFATDDPEFALTTKAKQIFKRTSDDRIQYDERIILQPNIPVVCIMGVARTGKSTLINGILNTPNACGTTNTRHGVGTAGVWITKYSRKSVNDMEDISNEEEKKIQGIKKHKKTESRSKDELTEFYLLEMEGISSRSSSAYVTRLFLACYAIANVIIWNDKDVFSDTFRMFMWNVLKPFAKFSNKPSFLYLERDAGNYTYDPFDTFDEYINKNLSTRWFRAMNIFSTISAYELDRPVRPRFNQKRSNRFNLNFYSTPENILLLKPLIGKISVLAAKSRRLLPNSFALKRQIEYINKSTTLSVTNCFNIENIALKYGCHFEGNQLCYILSLSKSEMFRTMMNCLGFGNFSCDLIDNVKDAYISATHCDNKSIMNTNNTLSVGDIYAINVLYNNCIDDCKIDECIISTALVMAVCISSYDHYDDLPGTKIDKKNMINLWEMQYGYEILYNQNDRVTQTDFFGLLNECRNKLSLKQNKNKYEGLFVIFSGHGTDDSLICSDGKKIKRSKITQWFNGDNVPFMSNQPKIIIMDACRGNDLHFGIPNNNKQKHKVKKGHNDDEHHPDEQIIELFSTTRGYAVHDDEQFGGNVIRTIYNTFSVEENVNKYHLDDLFKITQKRVKKLCSATQCIEQRNLGNDVHIFLKKNK
eukprot:12516_1